MQQPGQAADTNAEINRESDYHYALVALHIRAGVLAKRVMDNQHPVIQKALSGWLTRSEFKNIADFGRDVSNYSSIAPLDVLYTNARYGFSYAVSCSRLSQTLEDSQYSDQNLELLELTQRKLFAISEMYWRGEPLNHFPQALNESHWARVHDRTENKDYFLVAAGAIICGHDAARAAGPEIGALLNKPLQGLQIPVYAPVTALATSCSTDTLDQESIATLTQCGIGVEENGWYQPLVSAKACDILYVASDRLQQISIGR